MKYISFYSDKKIEKERVFDYLIETLRTSIYTWDYFVNWTKVQREAAKYTDELNLLNGLIGSKNLKKDFLVKIKKYPAISLTFPVLLAIRGNLFKISETEGAVLSEFSYNFADEADANNSEKYWTFFEKTGLADLFENRRIKSLPDYVFGVEAGLDSNGRKNRSGKTMERIVEVFIKKFSEDNGFTYLAQANSAKIKSEWKYDVPVDKSSRIYDFAVNTGKELIIFETNFYGGGGSKLKSTAGEYRNLQDVLEGKFKFVWITDGAGWNTTLRPLHETFDHNDYVFNLAMLDQGILKFLI